MSDRYSITERDPTLSRMTRFGSWRTLLPVYLGVKSRQWAFGGEIGESDARAS